MIIQISETPPNAPIVTSSKKVFCFFPLPTCQASANFSHSSRLGMRGAVKGNSDEGGRQGSQSSAAMLCAIFHCYDCCSSIIDVIHIVLFAFHLGWTRFCSLCAILLQCRVVQKHLQRKLLIDHLLDLPLLVRVKAV